MKWTIRGEEVVNAIDVGSKDILKVQGIGCDPVDLAACQLRGAQIYSRKIRENTAE